VLHRRLIAAALPLVISLAVVRCGTVAAVTPLHRGESSLSASLGGPVANVSGVNIPIPYAVARYRYGLSDQAGICAGFHPLAAGFRVIGLDFGFSYHFLKQQGWIPTVGAIADVTAFIQPGGGQALFPQLDLVASYRLSDDFITYFGSQSMYQFSTTPEVVLAPLVGARFKVSDPLSLGIEAKWYTPTELTHPRNVNYTLPIADHGAVGFVLGAEWLFGGNHE
jgi:hypothetical protein